MFKYIMKRLFLMIPVIVGISFILFLIMDLTPGDPARAILGDYATQEQIAALREEMGLNDNFFVRYFRYAVNAVQGDFGKSYRTSVPVVEEIYARFPATLQVAFQAIMLSILLGVPIGVVSAVRQYSAIDIVSIATALIFTSIPAFWFGLMLILLFSLKLGWLPAVGADSWKHFIMPSVTLAAAQLATTIRMTRSTMLEVIRQDYIRTAMAKGATRRCVIFKHALRNALLPVVTVLGIGFGNLLGGALIVESVFGISGLGTLMVNSVKSKDAPMLVASVMFAALVGSLVNLGVDVLYTYIDPRVKIQYLRRAKS
ncbi:peptide ABC transporter permease [Synergistales bacterium]|nr:peptide ABC transporter permease [Synergistales bacterium]